jgi:hypothetical protein
MGGFPVRVVAGYPVFHGLVYSGTRYCVYPRLKAGDAALVSGYLRLEAVPVSGYLILKQVLVRGYFRLKPVRYFGGAEAGVTGPVRDGFPVSHKKILDRAGIVQFHSNLAAEKGNVAAFPPRSGF